MRVDQIFPYLSFVSFILLVTHWLWRGATTNYKASVPGSLVQYHWKIVCRRWRYPGFFFWPWLAFHNLFDLLFNSHGIFFLTGMSAFMTVACLFFTVRFWKELKKQIEDDEDDPWNKMRRGFKKLARKAARVVAGIGAALPSPSPAPST